MSKKSFILPTILTAGSGGDGTVIGGGTGQSGSDPIMQPMSYENWIVSQYVQGYDFDGNGSYSHAEYAAWWIDNGFDMDAWSEYNPDIPWDQNWE